MPVFCVDIDIRSHNFFQYCLYGKSDLAGLLMRSGVVVSTSTVRKGVALAGIKGDGFVQPGTPAAARPLFLKTKGAHHRATI